MFDRFDDRFYDICTLTPDFAHIIAYVSTVYLSVEGAVNGVDEVLVLVDDSVVEIVSSHSGSVLLLDRVVEIRDDRTTICEV